MSSAAAPFRRPRLPSPLVALRQRCGRRLRGIGGEDQVGGEGQVGGEDQGSAIIEFIFIAVLALVPLIYLIVTVAVVQQGRLAVTNAARDVGRAIETAHSSAEADSRATAALSVALAPHHLGPGDVSLRYVAAGANCDGSDVTPAVQAGAEFAVCVIRQEQLPAVPRFFAGASVRLVGRFVVHIDDFAVIAQ